VVTELAHDIADLSAAVGEQSVFVVRGRKKAQRRYLAASSLERPNARSAI
jgi:hypothetical protein